MVLKPVVNNGKNYQPQLVSGISEPSTGSQVSECFWECFWEATSPPPNLHGWLHGECRFLFFLLVLAFQEITSLKQLDFEFTKSGSMIPPVLGNMVCFKIQICRPKNMSLKNQNKKKTAKKTAANVSCNIRQDRNTYDQKGGAGVLFRCWLHGLTSMT